VRIFFDGRGHFGVRKRDFFLPSFIRVSVRHMQRRDVVAPLAKSLVF
jgi:hypothetical protein